MHYVTHRPARGLVAAVVAALLAVGLLAAGATAQRSPEPEDGRELVQGLLLGTGPVAERLPEVFGELPKMPREAAKAQHVLLDAVAERSPRLYPSIEKAVASGDHVAVQQALDNGSQALHAVLADGKVFQDFDHILLPYHYTWHPYRWHFQWQPYRWTHFYHYDYAYDFDYDGTYRWRQLFPGPKPWFYELDPESLIANEKFVDLVVERFAV